MSKSRQPKAPTPVTDKARKAALKEVEQRLAKAEAPLHEATLIRGDGKAVVVTVPRDEPGGKKAKAAKESKEPRPLGGLDAAAVVLKEAKEPLTCKQIWAAIDARKLWFTEGKTPEATIYSAMIREIAAKKSEARFKKAARGRFALR